MAKLNTPITHDRNIADLPASQHRLRLLTASAAAALLATTWRLWWGRPTFPQVPLLPLAVDAPAWVDSVVASILAVALAVAFGAGVFERHRVESAAWSLTVVSLLVLMGLNQHRVQAWAYQFLLLALSLLRAEDDSPTD